jgi:hypothetical protein
MNDTNDNLKHVQAYIISLHTQNILKITNRKNETNNNKLSMPGQIEFSETLFTLEFSAHVRGLIIFACIESNNSPNLHYVLLLFSSFFSYFNLFTES